MCNSQVAAPATDDDRAETSGSENDDDDDDDRDEEPSSSSLSAAHSCYNSSFSTFSYGDTRHAVKGHIQYGPVSRYSAPKYILYGVFRI